MNLRKHPSVEIRLLAFSFNSFDAGNLLTFLVLKINKNKEIQKPLSLIFFRKDKNKKRKYKIYFEEIYRPILLLNPKINGRRKHIWRIRY